MSITPEELEPQEDQKTAFDQELEEFDREFGGAVEAGSVQLLEKLDKRDRDRWELDPASAEDDGSVV